MVGFTTDHRGLIFSVRRGAKSGGFVVQLDESIMTAVEELRALLAEEQAERDDAKVSSKRPESSLSVREVQARLRRGRTIEQVAREAGVDATWVSRFAVPVLAEQAEVIRAARATRMTKQRVGLSGASLGDSVYRNLAERGLVDPREELDKAWRARQLTEGMWLVSIKYSLRGRESEAVWEYDEAAGALRARGRLGTQLGFREPTRRASGASGASKASSAAKPATRTKKATKAKATTTARRSPSRQASKRVASARRAAAARMVSEAEKATRRNAALARKAATKPVVLPPRSAEPPPPREPLLVDEALEEPTGWDDELELAWDDAAAGHDTEIEDEDEFETKDDVELESEEDLDFESEEEVEVEVEVEVDPVPARPARRREPLRARPPAAAPSPAPASSAERARRQVRLRAATDDQTDRTEGNGPVFRSDLAHPAGERPSFPRSTVGSTPAPPLAMPLPPIEPPRRRRRRLPLRGR
jgi:PIN domain nuclease of toxin-antitoxin system